MRWNKKGYKLYRTFEMQKKKVTTDAKINFVKMYNKSDYFTCVIHVYIYDGKLSILIIWINELLNFRCKNM